jgi:hypothetical protein
VTDRQADSERRRSERGMRQSHDMNPRPDRMDDEREPESEDSEVEPEQSDKPRFGS